MKKRLLKKAFKRGSVTGGKYYQFMTRDTKYTRWAKCRPGELRPYFEQEFGKELTDEFFYD